MGNNPRRAGRIEVRADDPSLTGHGGLVVIGDLAEKLELIGLIDGELALERRARAVKVRQRGASPGELVVSLAECQLVGGAFFDHLADQRADGAGAQLRAVAQVPSPPAALQNSKRFRRVHCQRVERAMAAAGERLDRSLGRDPAEPVTVDLDATQITVYGRFKEGAARCRTGQMSYAPHVAFWAERGRALCAELVGGNQERLSGGECARIASRAIGLLPAGHGPVRMRVDSAYYAVELLERLRKEKTRFTVSVPRNTAMWAALARIPEKAWLDALEMEGAQVAEIPYKPGGWKHEQLRLIVRRVPFTASQITRLKGSRRLASVHPEQLQMALDGQIDSVYGYSFILTDIYHHHTAWVEHFHRHRAQIEERIQDTKLGQALRHLPSGDINANRVWLTASLLAVNLTAWCCDISPAAAASGQATDKRTPLRRHAHTLRRLLFNIPARVIRTGRRLILRLPDGYPHADIFPGDARHDLRTRAALASPAGAQHPPAAAPTRHRASRRPPTPSTQHPRERSEPLEPRPRSGPAASRATQTDTAITPQCSLKPDSVTH